MRIQRRSVPFLVLIAGFFAGPSRSQEVVELTLGRSIEMIQSDSPAAEAERLRFEEARWNYRFYRASHLPSLTLSGDAPGLTRSISQIPQDDGTLRFIEQSRWSSSLRLAVNQRIPMTGGQIGVGSEVTRIDEFGDNDFKQWQLTPLSIRLSQPILKFNSMGWERRTEPLRLQIAERQLLESLEDLAVDITRSFFNVYIAQVNVENARFNVTVNDSIFTLSKGRYEIGRISENDFLQSELAQVNAGLELTRAEITHEDVLEQLKIDLDLPTTTKLSVVPPLEVPRIEVDPDVAVFEARRNRSEYLDMRMDELEADREVDRASAESGFSADLIASYGLNQTGEQFDDLFRDPLDQQSLNVGFQVPIWAWGRGGARVEAAKASRGRTERNNGVLKRELDQEVRTEVVRFGQLGRQLDAAAKADTIAGRNFEVARNRYLIGKIDIKTLFDAQRDKDSARRAYIAALRDYWVSYQRLRRLTLYDHAAGRRIRINED